MNKLLDFLSDYFAHRKGLLPILGIILVIGNLVVNIALPGSWLAETDLLLNLGVILALVGILLAWAL